MYARDRACSLVLSFEVSWFSLSQLPIEDQIDPSKNLLDNICRSIPVSGLHPLHIL
jgi:hypothetical protein